MQNFRTKLILWNLAVLGILVSGMVTVLLAQIRANELISIDKELQTRSAPFITFAAHHLFLAGKHIEPHAQDAIQGKIDGWQRGDSSRTDSKDGLPVDRGSERLRWFRAPCFVEADGKPIPELGIDAPWDPSASFMTRDHRAHYTFSKAKGEAVRVLSTPIFQHGRWAGMVQMATPLAEFDQRWKQVSTTGLLLFLPALLGSTLGGWLLAGRALGPVDKVTRVAAKIGEGDLNQRIEVQGNDELANLAKTFNLMISKLETAFRHRADAYRHLRCAFDAQKQFTADASHELRTPLTRIKSATSLALSSQGSPDQIRRALEVADEGVDTMSNLISQLLLLARADLGRERLVADPVDIVSLIQDLTTSLDIPGLECSVPEGSIFVSINEDLIVCVIRNLIENATTYAVRESGEELHISISLRVESNEVVIKVMDNGVGIDPRHLGHLFDRFYRTDESRSIRPEGSGLGLAICQSIVQSFGGTITVLSELGIGSQFAIYLPSSAHPKRTK